MSDQQTSNNRVVIFDTTLRDGEQAPGASMTIPDKVTIAHQLSRLGVDVIEAGFPISSPGQAEAVRRISEEVSGPTICALARAVEGDINAAAGTVEHARKSRIHTFIATSDIHIQSKFADSRYGRSLAEKRKTILRMASEAVQLARTFTDDVEFSAEDAGRTSPEYLSEVVHAAVEAGATTVNIPDTTGYCLPDEYARLIAGIRETLDLPAQVVLSTHCHDDLGLATANSVAGLSVGARQVECTINGIGERAGNAALEEIVMALRVRAAILGLHTGIQTPLLAETSRMVSIASGSPVQPNKAVVGRNAFSHEAGIHQDGVLKERQTYEIMRAEDVGQIPEQIRLGRHSGRHGFFSRLKKMGIRLSQSERDAAYERFTALADKKKEIYDEDLILLVRAETGGRPKTDYALEFFSVSTTTGNQPEATVRINRLKSGIAVEKTASGDGPVDALYQAIDRAVGEPHDLERYSIRSVTEGADAVGEVTVVVTFGGKQFVGVSSSTDVIRASAEAYVEALNDLAAYRGSEEAASVKFVASGIMRAFAGGKD
jgi:2-isopropylmalate synthase